MQNCPLCLCNSTREMIFLNDRRIYFHCSNCSLIFVDAAFHLSKQEEKERYSFHQNDITQKGYVKFLNQAIKPTLPHLKQGMKGLDYGCGPNPTLSKLVKQHGYQCFDYDPVFEIKAPDLVYDFIMATECFEHFYYPETDLNKITSWLNPFGYLTIMTEQWHSLDQFGSWYYKNDPSHVSFYNPRTFEYIAAQWNFEVRFNDKTRVIILQLNKQL